MAKAGDFSGRPPGAAALKSAGITVVIRYIGPGSEGKQIQTAEWQDYINNGIDTLLVAELGINDAWEGQDDRALGVARARMVEQDIDATAPASVDRSRVLCACAADAHASGSQITDAVAYAGGFASVLGKPRSGFYGFSETSTAVHNSGTCAWHWRTGSEPSNTDKTWVNFWQRNRSDPGNPAVIIVNGTEVDVSDVYHIPTIGGPFMALTDAQQDTMAYQVQQLWDAFGQSYAQNGGQWVGDIVALLGRYMPAGNKHNPSDALSAAGGFAPVLMGLVQAVTALNAKVDSLATRPPADPAALAQALISAGFTGGASVAEVEAVVRKFFTAASAA